MDLLLKVPFVEKDDAKTNGARWNPDIKSWYVRENEKADYHKKWSSYFEKWLPKHNILCKSLYIFEMDRKCWKCGEDTKVICLATDDSYILEGTVSYHANADLQLLAYVENMPEELAKVLKDKFSFYPSYSRTIKKEYYINHCTKCKSVQGDNNLHEIPKEAFYKKLCYTKSLPAKYSKITNTYVAPIFAQLPYYDEMCYSSEMMLIHMKTGAENRASLRINQKLINKLFDCSDKGADFIVDGI